MGTVIMKEDKETNEKAKKRLVSMEQSKLSGHEKNNSRRPDGLTICRAYCPLGSLGHEIVDELPNWPTPRIYQLPYRGNKIPRTEK